MNAIDLTAWGEQPPLWVQLLAGEVARSNRTETGKRIGMSRSAVTLVLANRYPSPSTARVEKRVMDALGHLDCLAVGETVTVQQCQDFRKKPAPTHNPTAMQAWKACLHCPHNPNCTTREEKHHARIH